MVLASRQLAYLQDMSARETAFAVSRQRQSETREAEAARQAASGLVSELGAAWDTDVKCQLGAYLAARLVRHAHFEPGRRGGEAAWEGPGGELQPPPDFNPQHYDFRHLLIFIGRLHARSVREEDCPRQTNRITNR